MTKEKKYHFDNLTDWLDVQQALHDIDTRVRVPDKAWEALWSLREKWDEETYKRLVVFISKY